MRDDEGQHELQGQKIVASICGWLVINNNLYQLVITPEQL